MNQEQKLEATQGATCGSAVSSEYSYAEARLLGFACVDHPAWRVAAALELFIRKPIGLKYCRKKEQRWLAEVVADLPPAERKKVALVYVDRRLASRRAARAR